MSDLPSALGIEAVEFVAEGGRTVTVRISGRWRRRRPELRGQAMLVVETGTVRQRFVAMPEPPSLIGAAPGTWRMSFSVPAELAPQLPGKTFLQLGAMMVPLPVGEVPAPVGEVPVGEASPAGEAVEGPEEPDGPDPELLEARLLRSSELAAESARRRASEAEAAVAELVARVGEVEDQLAGARAESERLGVIIAERDRRLRLSEQHVHSERALRLDSEQRLHERSRTADHERRVLQSRVSDLERELMRMRREVDEAEHQAAAARASRAAREKQPVQQPLLVPPPPRVLPKPPREPPRPERLPGHNRADAVAAEFALSRVPATAGPVTPAPATAALERELADARHELAEARRELRRQRLLCERAYDAIDRVRGELGRIGETAAPEPPPPEARPARPKSEPVQAEQLSAALARLRAGAPSPAAEPVAPVEPAPTAPPVKPWLREVRRRLGRMARRRLGPQSRETDRWRP
jgi:hypothetical protein